MFNKDFRKFGKYKVIILVGIIEGYEVNYHHNVLILQLLIFIMKK